MYAYLSHYFFIVFLAVSIVRPYQIGFIGSFFIIFFGTFILIIGTYIPMAFLYDLVFPPPEVTAYIDKSSQNSKSDKDDRSGTKSEDKGSKKSDKDKNEEDKPEDKPAADPPAEDA